MNIMTSAPRAIQYSSPARSSEQAATLSTAGWGKSAVDTIADHPYRSIADVLSVGAAIGSLVAADSTPTGQFFKVATGVLAAGHVASAFVYGVSSGDHRSFGVNAVGDLVSAAGHGATLAGVGPVGAGMVVFGNMISTVSTFNS